MTAGSLASRSKIQSPVEMGNREVGNQGEPRVGNREWGTASGQPRGLPLRKNITFIKNHKFDGENWCSRRNSLM